MLGVCVPTGEGADLAKPVPVRITMMNKQQK
jgi:hypothetical protein